MPRRHVSEALAAIAFITGALQITSTTIVVELAARALGVHPRTIHRDLNEELSQDTSERLIEEIPLSTLELGLNHTSPVRRVIRLTKAGRSYLHREGFCFEKLSASAPRAKAMFLATMLVLEQVAHGAFPCVTGRLQRGASVRGDLYHAVLPEVRNRVPAQWNREPWTFKLVGGDLPLPVLIRDQSLLQPRIPEPFMDRLAFASAPHVRFNGWGDKGALFTVQHMPHDVGVDDIAGLSRFSWYDSVAEWSRDVVDAVRGSFLSWEQWVDTLTAIGAYARIPLTPMPRRRNGRPGTYFDLRLAAESAIRARLVRDKARGARKAEEAGGEEVSRVRLESVEPDASAMRARASAPDASAVRARAVHSWPTTNEVEPGTPTP